MKNKLLLIVIIFSFNAILLFAQEKDGKIIIYREKKFYGSAMAYSIHLNDSFLIRIRNSTYFEYECKPGSYKIMMKNNPQTLREINLKAGETYYFQFGFETGFWGPKFFIKEASIGEGNRAITLGKMTRIGEGNMGLNRNKNRIGVDMGVGAGFQGVPIIIMQNGDEAEISFGGGIGFNINYGIELNKHFDLAFDFGYYFSSLYPYLDNASIVFSRFRTQITPSYIIPIQGGYSMRMKIGGGLGYYFSPKLYLDTRELRDGFEDTWKYYSTVGIHGRFIYEVNPSKNWGFYMGLSFYEVAYRYKESSGLSYPIDKGLSRPKGGGFELLLGFTVNF